MSDNMGYGDFKRRSNGSWSKVDKYSDNDGLNTLLRGSAVMAGLAALLVGTPKFVEHVLRGSEAESARYIKEMDIDPLITPAGTLPDNYKIQLSPSEASKIGYFSEPSINFKDLSDIGVSPDYKQK